jgi:hypothetical protein
MTEIEIKTNQLNELILQGDTLKAMHLFYADQVEMQENEEKPRIGKAFCLKQEQENLQKVKSVQSKLLNQAIDFRKNVVFSEWEFTFVTHTEQVFQLTEISIQHWANGFIFKEKFYYKEVIEKTV